MLRLRRRTDTLVADSLTMEENETQEEDNARYEDELCPECGNMTGSTDVCASCGAKRMTAAATPDKVRTVMHEFKTGKLRLRGKGGKPGAHVTDRKQAIAIALSEARRAMTAAAFTAEERRNMAEKGTALADGSYPIPDVEYLRKAIHALGRASQHGDYDKVKRHIVKRARALKAVDELPSEWNITASSRTRLKQTVTAAFGTRAFDESKVRRVPKGSKGGGQFTVKENAAGRFEVVDQDTGKKVAEATTESDANAIAEHRNEAAPYTPPAEAPAPAPSPVEGPFTYPSGWTGRYDPVEGRYIGLDDVYMPSDFDPTRDPGRSAVAMPVADVPAPSAPAVPATDEFHGMSDREVATELEKRSEETRRVLADKSAPDGSREKIDPLLESISAENRAKNELTRRRVMNVTTSDEIKQELDAVDTAYGGKGLVGVSNVRKLPNGDYEVYETDRHGGSQTYGVFKGSKEDVGAFAQDAYNSHRAYVAESARSAADASLEGGQDWNKGRVTLNVADVPNDWAVANGYAEYVEMPPSYKRPGGGGPVQTIRWKQGTNPEAVLYHFLGGKPAPGNFPEGSRGSEQFGYGRGKLKGKNKAEREQIIRRITAALVAAGFVFDQDEFLTASLELDVSSPEAIVAAIPVQPPAEWFDNPNLDGPTPITVTSDGRIYGHAAVWGTCHLGNPRGAGVCVQPPRSQTDYGLFHLGEIETDGGGRVPVGQITLDTGHAPLGASARTAAAHYDDTGTVVADVTAGEDEHGIYFAGALRPDMTPERLRKLTASKISGDWRGGELVGMLAVNVPGFPVPRTKARLVASGDGTEEVLALVAAGIVGERELDARELEIRVQVLAARAEGGIDALADLAGA